MTHRSRLLHRVRDERGQALILATTIVLVGLLLGLAAVAFALSANQQSVHSERTRGAQQAADAGTQATLYQYSATQSVGFNLNGGVLGLGQLLDCTEPELGVNLQIVGTIQVAAGTSGSCPISCTLSGTTCTPGSGGGPNAWKGLDSEDYYESEFFPNARLAGGDNGAVVEFPQIVSIGCHTTVATNQTTSCQSGAGGNAYSRQLSNLAPTGPLDGLEGQNDVTINSGLNALKSVLDNDVTCTLGICTVVNSVANNLLTGLTNLLTILLGGTVSNVVNTAVSSVSSVGVIDSNVSAGNNLTIPALTVDENTGTNTLGSGLTNLQGVLSNLVGTLANPASLSPTFTYGNEVCNGTTSSCGTKGNGTTGTNITAVSPTFVYASGACAAGTPSAACRLQRPSFTLSTAPTAGTAIPTGITYSGTGTVKYSNGVLTVTGDTSASTLTFAAGSYVLCGLYADSNVTVTNSGSGAVDIYVEGPGQGGCAATQGNFVACGSISNTLTGGGLNGVTSAVNPTGLQIYVAGSNSQYTASGSGGSALSVGSTDTAPTSTCPWSSSGSGTYTPGLSSADPQTLAYVGNTTSTSSPTQAFILYAPESEAALYTSAAFEGSVIGFNTDITALAILQDLDLGNYPLSSVVNAYQVAQTVQCSNSIEALTGANGGNPGISSGGAGDLNGC